MALPTIVIKKKEQKLFVYNGKGKEVLRAAVAHGMSHTTTGTRKILKWVPGPVSLRADYNPTTWFSFGLTFHSVYKWPPVPKPGSKPNEGTVSVGKPKRYPARRLSKDVGEVYYAGRWWRVWKNSNPFGVIMADLKPGKIELHGTNQDEYGDDDLPTMYGNDVTHGCVRTYNEIILKIRKIAPIGTEVLIKD